MAVNAAKAFIKAYNTDPEGMDLEIIEMPVGEAREMETNSVELDEAFETMQANVFTGESKESYILIRITKED
jgi:hypothetical protein